MMVSNLISAFKPRPVPHRNQRLPERNNRFNAVLLLLSLVGILAAINCGLVSLAANRLVSGSPLSLFAVAGVSFSTYCGFLGLTLPLAAFLPPTRALQRTILALAVALLLLIFFVTGQAAHNLVADANTATRVSLGAAFWIASLCLTLIIVDALQRLNAALVYRIAVVAIVIIAVILMAGNGTFSDLSIVHEYQNRHDIFIQEFVRHLLLAFAAVSAALLIGVPLGIRALSRAKFRNMLFASLNLIQTIPSIAMFGLLIAPLSGLAHAMPGLQKFGVQGIGVTPALIALTAYALLPVARFSYAGFAGVDAKFIDAANGLGFSRMQRLWHVELPLALPVLLAGLRVVLVQVIGLGVVAALIGAGGLGVFVFQGIGQYAIDLVLLGAVPTILLAVAIDFLIGAIIESLPGPLGREPSGSGVSA